MKKLFQLFIVVFISCSSFGQIIKIQPGLSLANISLNLGSNDWSYRNKTLLGYSLFLGFDYLNNKYFNLSSNIGVLRKGGEVIATSTYEPNRYLKLKLDYLSINTTFEVQYPLKCQLKPFLSYGPRVDYLLNDTRLSNFDQFNYGLLIGGGLKYDNENLQFAIRTDYYSNFNTINKPITHIFGIINDRTLTCNFSIGYKL